MLFCHFLGHCFILTCSVVIAFQIENKITEGESLYKELTKKVASYGDCWKTAMADLHQGCKHLTEEIQSRLALSFSNCFLSHAGSEICPCPDDVPISVCLKNSNDRIFSTYTEFYTHTQSICHYLQHREWQEQTEKTVLMLTETSNAVSQKLDESFKYQSKILDLQQISFQDQQKLISNGRVLNFELQKSRIHAKAVFEEFKLTTSEHRLMTFEIFDRIQKLQNFVLGEFSGVYTVAYYLTGAVLIYAMTSIPQTASARIWLLILISANAVVERVVTAYSLEEMLKGIPLDSNDTVHNRIWLCRKVTCLIGFMILMVFYYRYKDYNIINNQLLKEIQQQNSELQQFIKSINVGEKVQDPVPKENSSKCLSSEPECIKSFVMNKHSNMNVGENIHNLVSETSIANFVSHKTSNESTADNSSHENSSSWFRPYMEEKSVLNKQNLSTPKKIKPRKVQSEVCKEVILKEKSDVSSKVGLPLTGRYNLRSRVNSPQSPHRARSPTVLFSDIESALSMHLLNKGILEKTN